jgi:hypothetical protein
MGNTVEGPRRVPLIVALIIMLVPIPLGAAMYVLEGLFRTAEPAGGGPGLGGPDLLFPVLGTSLITLVCTIVALPLTVRAPASPLRWVLLIAEIAALVFVARVGWFVFS